MSHEVATFGRSEEFQCRGDQRTDVVKRARAGRAEERFQFGEREFDRIEVGAVGREKPELGADGFDGGADLRLFVDGEIIEDHHIARLERRRQDLLDVGEERRIVDRAVEHGRRREPVATTVCVCQWLQGV